MLYIIDHTHSPQQVEKTLSVPNLTHLNIVHRKENWLIEAICQFLKINNSIKFLKFDHSICNREQLKMLMESLSFNRSLIHLDLKNSTNIYNNIQFVVNYLITNPPLLHLSLENTFLNKSDMICLADGLRKNYILRSLNLCRITQKKESGIDNIISALAHNKALQRLDLSHTMLSNDIGTTIAYMLCNNFNLEALNLSHNPLGKDSIQSITYALKLNNSLKILDLSGLGDNSDNDLSVTDIFNENKCLGEQGFQHLARMLTVNKGLKSLILNNNYTFTRWIMHLGLALIRNSTLCRLECNNKNTDIFDEIIFAWALKENRNLLKVSLSQNICIEKELYLQFNNIQAYNTALLIIEHKSLSNTQTLAIFQQKSAVEYILEETSFNISSHEATKLVEEALMPARAKYTLELLKVRKQCQPGISINNIDFGNKKYPFLEAMPVMILEKIFGYNVFEENVDKYVRSAITIKKKFNTSIEKNDHDTIERILPKMTHSVFDNILLQGRYNSKDTNIKNLIDNHQLDTTSKRKYQDFVSERKRAWAR
ncbi:Leucine-rich repeat protein [Rickettsiales bacterium Ac37b]|nr:Leucine-rich repeat protein [Rickettsiales bacterium Ac37b]